MKKICGIYKITSPSGKVYIGQGVNIMKRFRDYKNLHCKLQPRLYNSLKKYGCEKHTFEILQECKKEELDCLERYFQDFYNVLSNKGLNCQLTACGELKSEISDNKRSKLSLSHLGIKPSEKSTRVFVELITGRVKSEEERKAISERMSGSKNHFYGKKFSDQHRKKISDSNKGRVLSDEHKKKISDSNKAKNKGKVFSEEHRKKISTSNKGLYADEKHPRARLILCKQTGIFYLTLKSAAFAYNLKAPTLCAMLKGQNPNKTSLMYC